jgi:anion-transporting  ArsA/GET3 family ATPase
MVAQSIAGSASAQVTHIHRPMNVNVNVQSLDPEKSMKTYVALLKEKPSMTITAGLVRHRSDDLRSTSTKTPNIPLPSLLVQGSLGTTTNRLK